MADLLWYGAGTLAVLGGFGLVMLLANLGSTTIDPAIRKAKGDDRAARTLFGAVVAVYCLGLAVILIGAVWLGLWFGNHA